MTERLIAFRWIVSGRVQGVGFRWCTERRATDLGVAGWVRNLPDGRVEVVASGTKESLGLLDAYLVQGPRGARVENVEKAAIPPETVHSKHFYIK